MQPRIPQLDGVRGLAILVVMVHNFLSKYPSHPLASWSRFGWMGVDLFFVLSGFLITGILVDSKKSDAYFRNFYARRCLRILPLYFLVLVFMFVIVPRVSPAEGSMVFARSSPWWAYPFFLQNFLVHAPTSAVGPLGVTWSVAIEEQFYIAWAVLVRWCSNTQLHRIAIAVICFSPILRFYLSLHQVDLYPNVFCRLDALMAGGLLALTVRSQAPVPSWLLRAAWLALVVALSLAIWTEDFAAARWITHSLSAVASAAFVYVSLFATQRWVQDALRSRWLRYTGVISYGLYLIHKIPFDVLQSLHLDKRVLPALVMGLAASYLAATLSWHLLEKPFLGLKGLFGNSEPR